MEETRRKERERERMGGVCLDGQLGDDPQCVNDLLGDGEAHEFESLNTSELV